MVRSVIPGSAFGVAEHLVGLGYLLEAARGVEVVRVGVGMDVVGETPVGAADLLTGRFRRNLKPPVHRILAACVTHKSKSPMLDLLTTGYNNSCFCGSNARISSGLTATRKETPPC